MANDFLERLPLFAGLDSDDLEKLCGMAETVALEPGDVLMEEGSPGDALYITLTGRYEVTKRSGVREVVIAERGAGDIVGEMSLLELTPRAATVRALEPSTFLRISRAAFEQLLLRSPHAAIAVLHTVTSRLRNTELMLRQSEKMAALGTLSAGLAHELNNPAAAVKRSSSQLRQAIAHWQQTSAALSMQPLTTAQIEQVNILRLNLRARTTGGRALAGDHPVDAITRSDREAEMQALLEAQDIEDAWDLAPALVNAGFTTDELVRMTDAYPPAATHALYNWLATECSVYALLDEVHEGVERISEIVKAVRQYSYLDQAPVQLVDLHEGLDNTLVIMKHKLNQGVTVHKEYDPNLPRVEAYASELNQVWTNLIDNAIDAMKGQGQLTIRTQALDARVQVAITDDGPGIPAEIQPRLFDAFFTTKPPGVGTGLGLHTTYNIVVQKHSGDITVTSRPGETTFTVTLPNKLPARSRGA